MAYKILIVYLVYVVVVYLSNTYIFKENFADAVIKAVLSGVVFTTIYYFISVRNEKRSSEKKG